VIDTVTDVTMKLTVRAMLAGFLLFGAGCTSKSDYAADWHTEETHRWTPLADVRGDADGFTRLDSTTTGVGFVNTVGKDPVAQNEHLAHGSGVALGDITGNGWPDLYLARLEGPNALYHNQGGGQFEKVPNGGGAPVAGEYSTGAVVTDVTGDRRPDLLVTTMGGPNYVFENNNEGGFTNRRRLHAGRGSTTMALADISGNEALDLYVTNYKRRAMEDSLPPAQIAWEEVIRQVGEDEYEVVPRFQEEYEVRLIGSKVVRLELGEADRVYFNDGQGRFSEKKWTNVFRGRAEKNAPRDWGLVARLEDLNGDGVPDLYVCNDYESPDYYYLGREEEKLFRESPDHAIRTTSLSTMAIATTDLQRDGHKDFFLADMLEQSHENRMRQVGVRAPLPKEVGNATERVQEMKNTLQMNRGDGTFVEVADLAGVRASGWTWASTFLDVDLDGYEDLLATTGHAFNVSDGDVQTKIRLRRQQLSSFDKIRRLIFRYPRLSQKNVAYRNNGDGTFEEMEDGWGLGERADVSHGMASADLDRDGDLDVVINRLNQTVGIYRNDATASRLAVQLVGRSPNTEGIGATVRVEPLGGSVPPQETSVIAGGEYLSDSGETLSFATGTADSVRIDVQWPTGEKTVVGGRPGRRYDILQPGADPAWK
jgi:hypothetical protein